MSTETEPLYDVVIFNYETRIICTIAGERMRMSEGYTNAEKRLETALSRCNDNYGADIVPAGTLKKGDKLP